MATKQLAKATLDKNRMINLQKNQKASQITRGKDR